MNSNRSANKDLRRTLSIRIFILLAISLLFTSLFSCGISNSKDSSLYKELFAQGSNAVNLNYNHADENSPAKHALHSDDSYAEILALLPVNFVLLQDISVSLDADEVEEYIILYASREDLSVNLLIARFDEVSNRFHFVWKSETNAYGIAGQTRIELLDIDQDYLSEIVVWGRDKDNRQTLDVFKMKNTGNILSFQNNFSLVADGIDIIKKNTQQFVDEFIIFDYVYQVVVVNKTDDTFFSRELYQWNSGAKRIERISLENFSSSDVTQETLSNLAKSDNVALKTFLQGAWLKDSQDGDEILLVFGDETESITMYKKNEIFWYEWLSSFRNLARYKGIALHINMKSKILPSVFDWIQVEITSENTLYLAVNDNISSGLEGKYTKITNSNMLRNFFSLSGEAVNTPQFYFDNLIGRFNDSRENIYVFEYPRLRIINKNIDTEAIYNIISLDRQVVLEIKEGNEKSKFYLIQQNNKEQKGFTYSLLPINIYADNYYPQVNVDTIEISKVEKK